MSKIAKGMVICLSTLQGSKAQTPGSVLDEVPELLVPQDVLAQLLHREELLTPQQYLNAYYSPLNILMDSGKTPSTQPEVIGIKMEYIPMCMWLLFTL